MILFGLSTETKPTDVENGTTFYTVDTQEFFIFYKGNWYNQEDGSIDGEDEETEGESEDQNNGDDER